MIILLSILYAKTISLSLYANLIEFVCKSH